ncbi:MAG: hypothetical protein ACK4KV_01265 [Rhodocyclaceae bacterium]
MLTACSKVTMNNYNKLKIGMRYTEVVQVLGGPSSCSDVLTVKNCTWGDDKRFINVSFVADQVILFNAENLR